MKQHCAPVCQSCEYNSIEWRCRIDPDAKDAWGPGDLNAFFVNVTTLPENQKYKPKILSRPSTEEHDNRSTIDKQVGPWIVLLENFVSDEECNRLTELGEIEGYKRSTGVGKIKPDGTAEESIIDGRTSLNAWCKDTCSVDHLAQDVVQRIENLTNIPWENSESFQLLQYQVGHYYSSHHDYVRHHFARQPGVRIMTVFLYLNDVEIGGGTNFPLLGITGQ
jgi:prolyl 4-hydroxylase